MPPPSPKTHNAKPVPSLPPLPVTDTGDAVPLPPVPPEQDKRIAVPLRFGHTPLSAAFRAIQPSWRNYIMYADVAARKGNTEMQRYMQTWHSLPKGEQRTVFPEQLCELSGVSSAKLIAAVSEEVWIEGSAAAAMMVSALKPDVIERMAAYAMDSPDNTKHMELFSKVAGMMPQTNGKGGGGGNGFGPVTNVTIPMHFGGPSASVSQPDGGAAGSPFTGIDQEVIDMARVLDIEAEETAPAAMQIAASQSQSDDSGDSGDGDDNDDEEDE